MDTHLTDVKSKWEDLTQRSGSDLPASDVDFQGRMENASLTRVKAGASRFLIFTQSLLGPER